MKKKLLFSMMLAALAMGGTKVYADSCPVKIGDTCYDHIQEAFNAVPDDGTEVTVRVMENLTDEPGIGLFNTNASRPTDNSITYDDANQKKIVLDLENHTVQMGHELVGSGNTYKTQNIHLEKGNTVTIKNGKIISDNTTRMTFQNYSNLTLDGVTLDGTNQLSWSDKYPNLYYVLSNCNGNIELIGETSILAPEASDAYAFDVDYKPAYPNGTHVMIDSTGVIKGNIEVTSNAGSDFTIKKATIEGEIRGGNGSNITIEEATYEGTASAVIPNTSVTYTNETTGMNVVVPEDELVVMAFDTVLNPTEEQTNQVTEALEKGFVVGKFFDITAWETNPNDGNAKIEQVEEANEKVKVTLTIPNDLPVLQEGYKRVYKVIGIHNGVVTTYGVVDNEDGTISFMTDRFSPYALTYADEAPVADEDNTTGTNADQTNNPSTADKIILYTSALVVSAVAVTGTALYLNKRY